MVAKDEMAVGTKIGICIILGERIDDVYLYLICLILFQSALLGSSWNWWEVQLEDFYCVQDS